jgi:hypothetical protein
MLFAPMLLTALGGFGWWLAQPPSPLPQAIPALDEAGIRVHRASQPMMLRFAGNPAVFVLDFPNLAQQGAALNRVAALVEKAGLPRDRVLEQAELAAAIAAAGDTAETFYYGHNYRGADLARFFELATRDGLALTLEEAWVREQLGVARALVQRETEIAILSVAAPGAQIDESARASILRHELGHGWFATRPAYAEHVREAWKSDFSEAERAAFRAFLAREGYDTTDDRLMMDEAQAYLLFTPDPRFFNPGHVRLPEERVARLRALLRENAPGFAP